MMMKITTTNDTNHNGTTVMRVTDVWEKILRYDDDDNDDKEEKGEGELCFF
jgi:hypothetical protein